MNTNSPDLFYLAVEQVKTVVKTIYPLSKVRAALFELDAQEESAYIIKNEGQPSPAMIEKVGKPIASYFAAEYINILAYMTNEKNAQASIAESRESVKIDPQGGMQAEPFEPQAEKPVDKTEGREIPAVEEDVDPKGIDLIADEHIIETKDSDKPAVEEPIKSITSLKGKKK